MVSHGSFSSSSQVDGPLNGSVSCSRLSLKAVHLTSTFQNFPAPLHLKWMCIAVMHIKIHFIWGPFYTVFPYLYNFFIISLIPEGLEAISRGPLSKLSTHQTAVPLTGNLSEPKPPKNKSPVSAAAHCFCWLPVFLLLVCVLLSTCV